MDRSKFWTTWFNAGAIISIIILPIVMIAILRVTFNIWAAGPSTDNKNTAMLLEPMVLQKYN